MDLFLSTVKHTLICSIGFTLFGVLLSVRNLTPFTCKLVTSNLASFKIVFSVTFVAFTSGLIKVLSFSICFNFSFNIFMESFIWSISLFKQDSSAHAQWRVAPPCRYQSFWSVRF